jgi:hypothetical protein
LDQDVAIGRSIHEIHFVLQARASPANHRHPQRTGGAPLFLEERIELSRGGLSDFDEALVADLVIDGGSRR